MSESIRHAGVWRSVIALGRAIESYRKAEETTLDARTREHLLYLSQAVEGLGQAVRNRPTDHI
jgi:hypothetical protein